MHERLHSSQGSFTSRCITFLAVCLVVCRDVCRAVCILATDGQEYLGPVSQDKFLIQACRIDREVSELLSFWKTIDKETVLETL